MRGRAVKGRVGGRRFLEGNGSEEPPVAATEGDEEWSSVVLERHYIQSRTAIIAAPAGTFTRPSNTKSHYTARRAALLTL